MVLLIWDEFLSVKFIFRELLKFMQHDVLHTIEKEQMPVGCYAIYDMT